MLSTTSLRRLCLLDPHAKAIPYRNHEVSLFGQKQFSHRCEMSGTDSIQEHAGTEVFWNPNNPVLSPFQKRSFDTT
jgi:hypothetical protein